LMSEKKFFFLIFSLLFIAIFFFLNWAKKKLQNVFIFSLTQPEFNLRWARFE
jgi:hypothetical protein